MHYISESSTQCMCHFIEYLLVNHSLTRLPTLTKLSDSWVVSLPLFSPGTNSALASGTSLNPLAEKELGENWNSYIDINLTVSLLHTSTPLHENILTWLAHARIMKTVCIIIAWSNLHNCHQASGKAEIENWNGQWKMEMGHGKWKLRNFLFAWAPNRYHLCHGCRF